MCENCKNRMECPWYEPSADDCPYDAMLPKEDSTYEEDFWS